MTYRIEIDAPEVPYPGGTSHADFLRRAARNINTGFPIGGSNVTNTVVDLLSAVADAMDAQKPRIPEPGLWGVVEAKPNDEAERQEFVRYPDDHPEGHWESKWYGSMKWDELIDPTLIREGLS